MWEKSSKVKKSFQAEISLLNLELLVLCCSREIIFNQPQVQTGTQGGSDLVRLSVSGRQTSAFFNISSFRLQQLPRECVCLTVLFMCVYVCKALPALWQCCDRNILLQGQQTGKPGPPFSSVLLSADMFSSCLTAHLTFLGLCSRGARCDSCWNWVKEARDKEGRTCEWRGELGRPLRCCL